MLNSRDANGPVSGRNSRASNLSNVSRMTNKHPGEAGGGAGGSNAQHAAVQSMLRTTTEMGNVVGHGNDLSGFGGIPLHPQRRGASSRMSTTSSVSNQSSYNHPRQHRQYPSSSSAPRQSMPRDHFPPLANVPYYAHDTLSPMTMNLSGSSPMLPMPPRDRDSGQRSRSMTQSVQQPDLRLSNTNRSMGSLRTQDPMQRSNSPLVHPSRFGNPSGFRAASPAWSDMPGRHPRRVQAHGGPGPMYSTGPYPPAPHSSAPYPPGPYGSGPGPGQGGQMRHRAPSDASLANSERSQRVNRRGPSRGPSPVYYPVPHGGNVPPMPPLHQHYRPAVEQARIMNNSLMGSASSGSINLRTDSDTPSSDLPQPPTPRDGMSVGQPYNRMRATPTMRTPRDDMFSGTFYYDGSEQFETDNFTNPGSDRISTGYAYPGKKPVSTITPPRPKGKSSRRKSRESASADANVVAELPASPVPHRITRTLVKSVLEPFSTTDNIGLSDSASVTPGEESDGRRQQEQINTSRAGNEMTSSSAVPLGIDNNRDSVSSQMETSFLESSTVDLARGTFLPALTGTAVVNNAADDAKAAEASPGSPEKSTDDGMSELLAGYQHTDSKQQGDIDNAAQEVPKSDAVAKSHPASRRGHAKTSSDDQSFKTCTDALDHVAPIPLEEDDMKQDMKLGSNDAGEASAKIVDAQYEEAQEDMTTPRQTMRPPSRLPPPVPASSHPQTKAPAVDASSASPCRNLYRKADSSVSLAAKRLRGSSKPSVKDESVSNSGSSSTLNSARQPIVPPRQSSISQEASRTNAVGSFLMAMGFKRPKNGAASDDSTPRASGERSTAVPLSIGSIGMPVFEGKNTLDFKGKDKLDPEQIRLQNEELEKLKTSAMNGTEPLSSQSVDLNSPSEALRVGLTLVPDSHQRALSSPMVGLGVASSVYSPQDVSMKLGTNSSPAALPASPESSRRDSQSTTHLSWIGRKPFGSAFASASESHVPLPSVQEDTTTALRYSGYRFNYPPQRYLPDLKEESHEDSSLNTSASNLKGSQFRFPFGGGPGLRSSVDDAVFLSRKSSTRSHRRSAAWEAHGLPCMEFSHANLLEKLKDALGDGRFSRSLDLPDVEKSTLQRSVSAGQLREEAVDLGGSAGVLDKAAKMTGVIDFGGALKRPCQPELMAEIDRLSIPSVTQLTQRFTELLPSLSLGDYYRQPGQGALVEFPEEEELMEHALESIHEVNPPSQKRSSARLRPVRGASALMVVDDDVFEELTSKERGGPSADARGSEGAGAGIAEAAGQNNKLSLTPLSHTPSNTKSRQNGPRRIQLITALQPPSPAVLRPRSNTAGALPLRSSFESALSSTRSLRLPASTPTATVTRPWNFDEFYPWATAKHPAVDISLPAPSAAKASPRPGPSHLRNTLSDASTSTFTSALTTTASPPGNATDNATRHPHRLSLFGRSGDQAHAVGERYPTSALSPPTAIFRDNLSACDTSDDEELTTTRKTRLSLRKRFSSAARSNANGSTPSRGNRSKVNASDLASPASAHDNSTSTLQDHSGEARAFTSRNRHTFRDAQGMTPSDYRRQRLIRTIKRFFRKIFRIDN